MTDRDLLRQALEALEYVHEGANNQGPHTGISWRCASNKVEPAITALRERLAQPEQRREWVGLTKEEAKEISLANRPYVVDMVAALEARLKEKNNG